MRLHRGEEASSSGQCLTLAERAPAGNPAQIPLIEACLDTIPNDAELAADLGDAYAAAGRSDDATRAYLRALEIDPDYGDVHLKLAEYLVSVNERAAARSHVEAALEIQPNRRAARELLARIEAAK